MTVSFGRNKTWIFNKVDRGFGSVGNKCLPGKYLLYLNLEIMSGRERRVKNVKKNEKNEKK